MDKILHFVFNRVAGVQNRNGGSVGDAFGTHLLIN